MHPAEAVRWFGDLGEAEWPLAGGKAGTLARLYQTGYPVPAGFVILPGAFLGDELAPGAWTAVLALLERLRRDDRRAGRGWLGTPTAEGGTAFAVRSSALGEDTARASFAGEFETVLDVRTEDALRAAIHTVRRSRHSERVRAYARAMDLDSAQPAAAQRAGAEQTGAHEMAVIVQRMVPAEMSGVLFTADPVTGSRAHMVGNYVRGLGDRLVSGEAQPQAFTLSRPGGRYEGPPELRRQAGLFKLARQLFKLAQRLERDLGAPQDIEWAVAGRELHLLQSRPITTLQGFNPVTGEFNDSLTGDYLWSCVNIGEAMSVVMTPYSWSVLRIAYDELNLLPGYPTAGNIGGRAYQNSTVMVATFRALGRNMEDLSQEVGGVRDEYLERLDEILTPLPEATFLAVLPRALRMLRKQRAGLKDLDAFLAGNLGWCQVQVQRIRDAHALEELASLMVDEMEPYFLRGFWRMVATVWHYGERVGRLRRELKELVGVEDADALLSSVSSQDALLASLGPVVGLARVARGEMSREAYLAQWGHRGPLETEAYVPRPFEDPGWLDQQLAAFARSPVDVEALLAAQRREFEAAWARFCDRYPRKARATERRLNQAAEAARMREAVRSEFTRVIWVARTWVLRAGELTGIGDGAFFLTYDELLDLLAGNDAPVPYIPARRRTYERYKALPPYPLIIRGRFDPVQWAADLNRRNDVFDSHGTLPGLTLQAPRENMILGMPGSAGLVEGRVRRLTDPQDGDDLKPGEILVTSQTNIGWTLFFPRAAAIVTDVGAPLSHAAIVARELGIPAVVNCGDATARLRTGDRVRVDGGQGVVEILEEAPSPTAP